VCGLPAVAGEAWLLPLGLFIAGWVLQFAGHAAEGVAPKFSQQPDFLVMGPLMLVETIYRAVGVRLDDSESNRRQREKQ